MKPAAFVDETYSDMNAQQPAFYQLTAVVIDSADVSLCRAGVVKVAPSGFHAAPMAAKGDVATVTSMLQYAASNVGWSFITMMTSAVKRTEPLRQRCLEELLILLNQQGVGLVVADSRREVLGKNPHALNQRDLMTYQKLRTAGQLDSSLTLQHQSNQHEPLLGLPDAVGWAHRRQHLVGDSAYWPMVQPVTTVMPVAP